MTKVALFCPYPLDEAPSQRFRFEQYLIFLEQEGVQVKVYPFLNKRGWAVFYAHGKPLSKIGHLFLGCVKRVSELWRLLRVDIIFIHREIAPLGPPVFEWIIAKVLRKRIIYDFDDAIWLPNYSKQHRKFHRLKSYWKVKYIVRWADTVSVGNTFLSDFARKYNTKVLVLPTTIDTSIHAIQRVTAPQSQWVIGWTGTHTTVHYLLPLVPVLQRLSEEIRFDFVVISNEPPPFDIPNLKYVPWHKSSEIANLSKLSVGVMPLIDDDWTRGKCGFKALQYMALCIPTIASKVGVNKEIIQHGSNGFLAETPEEWYRYLTELYLNRGLGKSMGEAGRETVCQRYSVEAYKHNYLKLFKP